MAHKIRLPIGLGYWPLISVTIRAILQQLNPESGKGGIPWLYISSGSSSRYGPLFLTPFPLVILGLQIQTHLEAHQ